MLYERLEHLEEDCCAHGESHLQHFKLGLSGSHWQSMVLYKHVRDDAQLEHCIFNSFIHAVQLILIMTLLRALGHVAPLQQRVEDGSLLALSVAAEEQTQEQEALRVELD